MTSSSHPKHTVPTLFEIVWSDHDAQAQDLSSISGKDHSIIPDSWSGVVAAWLMLISIDDDRLFMLSENILSILIFLAEKKTVFIIFLKLKASEVHPLVVLRDNCV